MKGSRSTVVALISLLVLAVALVVLGTLQYRWIGEMANAERQRMRSGIEFAAHHYSDDFDHELTRMFFAFQIPLPEANPEHILKRYDEWAVSARDPRIVRAIYFVPPVPGARLQKIDPRSRSIQDIAWPVTLAALQPAIAAEVAGGRPVQPIVPGTPAIVIPCGGMRRVMFKQHLGDMAEAGIPIPHMHRIPALEPPNPAFTILELDRDYIARVVFPDLTHRYFDTPDGREFEAAIVAPESGTVIYRSDASLTGAAPPFRADFTLPIFSVRALRREPEEGLMFAPPSEHRPLWHLLVRHHNGTLEEVVGATRRRNLMLTGGILAVLAATVVALAAMLRGAERLRLQQLEFVAGVTHELNTPVAALNAAGQNLADGIITEPSQVIRYGSAIVKESRRLTEMIGQVLAYGGMQSRRKLTLTPLDIHSVIDEAVATCRWMADEQSVVVETNVARGLPVVEGDAASLARALQNLLANGIRHGASGKLVSIHASTDGGNVLISVADRGPGIATRDLPHLFEPFYRGRGADRIRGSGLGLTIVKQIVTAHGGSVAVERRRDGGALFSIRIPARNASVTAPELVQHA
jgi:signal transduction histidine kinase